MEGKDIIRTRIWISVFLGQQIMPRDQAKTHDQAKACTKQNAFQNVSPRPACLSAGRALGSEGTGAPSSKGKLKGEKQWEVPTLTEPLGIHEDGNARM